jgi:hypothetical protein
VGETTAASAKATANGIAGIIQVMKYPTPEDRQRAEAERQLQDCPLVAEQSLLRNAPAIQEKQRGQNRRKKICGPGLTPRLATTAMNAPGTI